MPKLVARTNGGALDKAPRKDNREPVAKLAPTPDERDVPLNFVYLFGGLQGLFVLLFFVFVEYDDNTDPATDAADAAGGAELSHYSMWQDVHVMIFVGFGFLMTFLRSYGYSALTLNFLVGVFAIQWGILTTGFCHSLWEADGKVGDMEKIPLHMLQLVEGDFAAATALISLGAVLGKTTPAQTLCMVTIELVFYAINYQVIATSIGAADVGGTLAIHTFGAYFGLAVSWVLSGGTLGVGVKGHKNNAPMYHSDLFSMVGTLFLWCFWPSFVAVLAEGNAQNRAVVHTVLSLCSSCLTACVASALIRPHHKFDMVDIQNATLAGGVAIGAVADHYLGGGGALVVGVAAGALSTVGYVHVQPYLEAKLGLFDTCGVHNLHGMPGVLGGLAAVLSAAFVSSSRYGDNAGDVFAAMEKNSWSASTQSGRQFAALVVTVAIALTSGAATGYLCKVEALVDAPPELFNDVTLFEVPEDGPVSADSGMDVSVGEPISESAFRRAAYGEFQQEK